MMTNLALWSPLISLFSVALLYPLRLHSRNALTTRLLAAIFLLPATVAIIFISKVAYYDNAIINKTIFTYNPSFNGAISLTQFNSPLVASAILLAIVLTFFLPSKRMAENLSMTAVSLGLLSLISVIQDRFLQFSIYSFGTIILTFMIINDRDDVATIKYITTDFLIQRASDVIALVALLILLIDGTIETHENNLVAHVLYFFAIMLKVLSSIFLMSHYRISPEDPYSDLIPRKIYYGAGPQILFLQFSGGIFKASGLELAFIAVAAFIFILTALTVLQKETKLLVIIFELLICATFFANCIDNYVALSGICCMILIYPLLYLHQFLKVTQTTMFSEIRQSTIQDLTPLVVIQRFLTIPLQGFNLLSKIFLTLFNYVYAGIVLYRIPKLLLGILQIPLRLVNNGNIQRSMMFVSIMLVGYFLWWGHR